MKTSISPTQTRIYRKIGGGAGLAAIAVSALVLLGWAFDWSELKSVVPGAVAMRPVTALCFGFIGIAMRLAHTSDGASIDRKRVWALRCVSIFIAAVALITLIEYISGQSYPMDEWLFSTRIHTLPGVHPGRMSPLTDIGVLFVGLSLLGLDYVTKSGRNPAQYFAMVGGVIGYLSLASYAFGRHIVLDHSWLTSTSTPAAVLLVTVALGLLCLRPGLGVMRVVSDEGVGGWMARRLLPAAVVLPFLLGWLRTEGTRAGWFEVALGLALLITSFMVAFAVVVWRHARLLNQNDAEQKEAAAVSARLAAIVESSTDAIIGLDLDGVVTNWNHGSETLYGYTAAEMVGRSVTILLPPDRQQEEKQILARVERGENLTHYETKRQCKDGRLVEISITISPIRDPMGRIVGASKVARDITKRKHLEQQLNQAKKLEAIGTLAGGIAHDFNNILAAIMGYADLARMKVSDPAVLSLLEPISAAGLRAAGLIKQILAFSRKQEHERVPIQLRHVLIESMKLLRATIPATIEFKEVIERDLPVVLADATQVQQVIMNLCTNAWHAMRKSSSGRLTVALERFEVDGLLASNNLALVKGIYVRLTVSDTGHGMDQRTVARIFEPFFTTKSPGEGTGLGLSVVHGIMEEHEGTITVYSEVGLGTTFHAYFPALTGDEVPASDMADAVPRGKGQRILVVDDERTLAELVQKLLIELGYRAEAVTDSIEALDRVRQDISAFDLVVTDYAMPRLDGLELAAQIHELNPKLRVVLTSGFTGNLTPERLQKSWICDVMPKPHTARSVGTHVFKALAET